MTSHSRAMLKMLEVLKADYPEGDMRIIEAMRSIPRHEFTDPGFTHLAYENCTLPIGHDQTLSKPSTVYRCLSMLNLCDDQHLLEIGSGTGYLAAIASRICNRVTGIENKLKLANESRNRLRRLGVRNVTVIYGDGSSGYEKNAPFDAIILSAVCSELPVAITNQLLEGGLVGAPIRDDEKQVFRIWKKREGNLEFTGDEFDCRFVPLTGNSG